MRKEETVNECRFRQGKDYLEIKVHEYFTFKNSKGLFYTCYLHNEDILFVLNTFRKIGKEGYYRWGGVKERVDHGEDDRVKIDISYSNDRGSFGLAEIIVRNEKGFASFTFEYDVRDPMNPDDSLYQFLVHLEKYVPKEQKPQIIPQWR